MLLVMCGRYASFLRPDVPVRLFEVRGELPNLVSTWNRAPIKRAPVIRLEPETDSRTRDALQWGLMPSFVKDPTKARKTIKVRGETVSTSPIVRLTFAHCRCQVLATTCCEWPHDPGGKMPFAIAREDGWPAVFGRVWGEGRSPDGRTLETFATLSIDANPQLRLIQYHMPAILERDHRSVWPGEEKGDVTKLLRPLIEMPISSHRRVGQRIPKQAVARRGSAVKTFVARQRIRNA